MQSISGLSTLCKFITKPSEANPLRVGTHWLHQEDYGGGNADRGHEGMCASVIAGVDAPLTLPPLYIQLDTSKNRFL